MTNKLELIEHTYPNGDKYYIFKVKEIEIGRANKVDELYIPWRKYKPLPKEQAAIKMLKDHIFESQQQAHLWESLLNEIH